MYCMSPPLLRVWRFEEDDEWADRISTPDRGLFHSPPSLGVPADGDGADGQAWPGVDDLAEAGHLVVEIGALGGREAYEGLDGDVDAAARAPLVPQPGDHAVDQEDLEVAAQHPAGGGTGIEALGR